MTVFLLLLVGGASSLFTKNWLPVVVALVLSSVVHELMLYDMHKHILFLEDKRHG